MRFINFLIYFFLFSRVAAQEYCSGLETLSTASGEIRDHTGVGNSKPNSNCLWSISSPSNTTFTIFFDKVDTEFFYDYLIIYDGPSPSSPPLVWLSGKMNPQPVTSTKESIAVSFQTDSFNNGAGFSLSYHENNCPLDCNGNGHCINGACQCFPGFEGTSCSTTSCPNNCNEKGTCDEDIDKCICDVGYYGGDCQKVHCDKSSNYTQSSGTFSNANTLSSYHPNTNCQWRIEPEDWEEGDSIALSFQRIDTEESYDLISVYDGDTLIGQFSGVDIPNRVVATSGIMIVEFTSDEGVERTGFTADYELVKCPGGCGNGYCTALKTCMCNIGWTGDNCDQAECFEPRNNTECWDRGTCEDDGTCHCDEGWDGIDCGICTGSECVSSNCGGLTFFDSETGILVDRTGAAGYLPSQNCNYRISRYQTGPSSSVTLEWQYFNLPTNAEVTVYDGPTPGGMNILGIFRGNSLPPSVTSSGPDLYVSFRSVVGSSPEFGFRGTYRSVQCDCNGHGKCNPDGGCLCDLGYSGPQCQDSVCPNDCGQHGTCVDNVCQCFRGFSGVACEHTYCDGLSVIAEAPFSFSDHYVGIPYQSNANCRWQLTPGGESGMSIFFTSFQTQSPTDQVYIYNSTEAIRENLLTTLSGRILPEPIFTPSSIALVHFESDYTTDLSGFSVSFFSNGDCTAGCSSQGYCFNRTCICFPGKGGLNCEQNVSPSPITLGTIQSGTLESWKWKYFSFDVSDDRVTTLFINHTQTSNSGYLEFYLNKGAIPTPSTFMEKHTPTDSATFFRIAQPEGRWFVAVHARETADYQLNFAPDCILNFRWGTESCICEKCRAGADCTEPLCGNEEVCNEEGLCVCAPGFCESEGLSTGAIVAIAILVPLGIVLIVGGGGAYLFYRKYGLDRSYAFRRRGEE